MWTPVARVGSWMYVLEYDLYRPDSMDFLNGTYTWDGARWVDGSGTPVATIIENEFIPSRLQAYYLMPVPDL